MPLKEAYHIHGSSNQNMLKMCFLHSQIARNTKIKSSHSLRNRAFNPRSFGISFFECFGRLAFSSCLNSLMMLLLTKDDLPRVDCCTATLCTGGTRTTIFLPKLGTDHIRNGFILLDCPLFACFPLRTG